MLCLRIWTCKLLVVNEHELDLKPTRYISTTPSFCLFDHTGHQIQISTSMFRCGLVNRAIPLNTGGVPHSKLFAKILSYNVLRGPDNELRDQTCSLADKQPSKSSELPNCMWLLIAVSHFDSRPPPHRPRRAPRFCHPIWLSVNERK